MKPFQLTTGYEWHADEKPNLQFAKAVRVVQKAEKKWGLWLLIVLPGIPQWQAI